MSEEGESTSVDGRGGLARSLAWLGLLDLAALWARPSPGTGPAGAALAGGAGTVSTDADAAPAPHSQADRGPGEEHPDDAEATSGLKGYTIGLGLAALLTTISFGLPATGLVWGPVVSAALIVFAIAQMGVHLVFFLHLTTGPDNTNNVMALAFGCLIVLLLIGGSLWIMSHLDQNMMGMDHMMQM